MVIALRFILFGALGFGAIAEYFSPSKIHLVIIGIAPALIWLTFFLTQERRKNYEPAWEIFLIFLMGISAALITLDVATFMKINILDLYEIAARSPIGLLTLAFVEELIKFLSVYFIVRRSKYFDEPLDAMLDMITCAMGFAALENVLYIIRYSDDIASASIFRFVGAVLLHAIASGFVGYYWAKKKAILGIIVATAIHFIFNSIILYASIGENEYGIIIAPIFLIIMSFFLFKDFDIIKRQ